MIRPPRRGVGGLCGTLFFQTDRGAAGEHVDSGPEEAHAGFQAVRALTFALMTAPPHSCGAAGRGSGTPSSHNAKRADCGPIGTDGSPVLAPVRTPSSLLPHSSDVRNFDTPSPKSKKMAMVYPRILRCPLESAARCLALEFKPHPSDPALCRARSLSPKSKPLQNLFLCLLHQFCWMVLRSSLRGRVEAKSAPPFSFFLQRGWGLQREVRRWLTHPPKPDSPSPARKDLESWLRDLGFGLAARAASAFWNSALWPGV